MCFFDLVVLSVKGIESFGFVINFSKENQVFLIVQDALEFFLKFNEKTELFLILINDIHQRTTDNDNPSFVIFTIILGFKQSEQLMILLVTDVFEVVKFIDSENISELTQQKKAF